MNNKGFTLIELIGVMLLLAIIAMIAFPSILSSISKNEDTLNKDNQKLIISDAKRYVLDNQDNFLSIDGKEYCIKVKTLYDKGYANNLEGLKKKNEAINSDAIKVKYNSNKFNYSYVKLSSCSGQTY